jgi:hypothetical protein
VENGRAGWAKWMDSTLDEEEARNVVLNLSRYPSVEGLLRDLLPDLSVEDIEVAASLTKKGRLHRMRRVARIEGKDARTAVRLAREARRAHGPKELEKRVHSAQTVLDLFAARVLTERELIDAFDHHDIELGDSTLSVRDAARLLGDMHIDQRAGAGPATSIVGLEDIFFGSTPMCAAVRRARCRFKAIRADLQKDRPLDHPQRPDAREVLEGKGDFGSSTHRDSKSLIDVLADIIEAIHLVASLLKKLEDRSKDLRRCTLVIVSDGLPTDGDPRPVLEDMRTRGAVIISCLVTSRDLGAPRSLVAEPEEGWDASALLMFQSASTTLEAPSPARFLTDNGWSVPPGARLFTQINHSAVLCEFLESALG